MSIELDTASAPPTTTAEQDKHSLGQRRVNIIWEATQAVIAIGVVAVALWANLSSALNGGTVTVGQSTALTQLDVMAALVTGFYFGRTNHQRVGGVELGR